MTAERVVYRNLNYDRLGIGERWSIVAVAGNDNRGKLQGYAQSYALRDCRFVVKANARERIAASIAAGKPSREVCAWIIGTPCALEDVRGHAVPLTFSPEPDRPKTFVRRDNSAPLARANFVTFGADGRAVAYEE
jgi:hypothetical protein